MTVKETINKLASGNAKQLEQKIINCKSVDEAYCLAKNAGMGGSKLEFVAEMAQYYASILELSDEQLDAVAGGAPVIPDFISKPGFWYWNKIKKD